MFRRGYAVPLKRSSLFLPSCDASKARRPPLIISPVIDGLIAPGMHSGSGIGIPLLVFRSHILDGGNLTARSGFGAVYCTSSQPGTGVAGAIAAGRTAPALGCSAMYC